MKTVTKAELEEMLLTLYKLQRAADKQGNEKRSAACTAMIGEAMLCIDEAYSDVVEFKPREPEKQPYSDGFTVGSARAMGK